jgi:two-component system, NarL family, invasion response regulator UvrY
MVGVLVADDRPPFRRAVRTILSATPGFELLGEAVSGEDAVALTRALCPDVVLMDVRMPGMGGIEATRRIRAVAGETVVVLVSSYPEEDLPEAASDCGAVAFVPKEGFGRQMLEELWGEPRATSPPSRGTATRP